MNHTVKTTLFAVMLSIAYACQKSNDTTNFSQSSQVQIRMTDAPYDAQQVNIDLREVRLKYKDDSWTSLQTNAGIYNLLDFQNGLDTLIATGTVPANTTLQEVRLILGSDNTIMIDSVLHLLTIPSGSESGLKVKLDKKSKRAIEEILLDFDANLSVIKTGNGEYKLKPVIKFK